MNPGYYRDIVTVQTESTVVGADHRQTVSFVDGESFWCRLKLQGGFEITEDMIIRGESQFEVRCEYNPVAAALKTNQRLKVGTRNDLIFRSIFPA